MVLAVALAIVAAVAYALTLFTLWRKQPQIGTGAMLAGALALLGAAITWWFTEGYARVVPWWIAFLIFTVAGERLELTRFQRVGWVGRTTGAIVFTLLIAGSAVTQVDHSSGSTLLAVGMAGTAVWSALRDPARRTVRSQGTARLAAVGVLTGYAWLAVSGLLMLVYGLRPSALSYDAVVHAFFIGFAFAAIIAHEPLIAPAVSGIEFVFTRLLYVPLVLLGVGLIGRIAGDLANLPELRRASALLQAVTLVLLLLLTVHALALGLLRVRAPHRPGAALGESRKPQ